MPYVTKEEREELEFDGYAATAGELNYLFTKTINKFIDTHGLSYQKINDIIGALEGAKMEFYRRVVVPYEDRKIKENGDVY